MHISVKQIECEAERLGCQIAEDERIFVEGQPNEAKTLYFGMDGTGIPARASETVGRCGKQRCTVRIGSGQSAKSCSHRRSRLSTSSMQSKNYGMWARLYATHKQA